MPYKTNCFGCLVEMELKDKHPEGPLRQLDRMALHFCDDCADGWDGLNNERYGFMANPINKPLNKSNN